MTLTVRTFNTRGAYTYACHVCKELITAGVYLDKLPYCDSCAANTIVAGKDAT